MTTNTASNLKLEKLTPEQRRRRTVVLGLLARALREVVERTDGFDLRFGTGASTWMVVAEFVNLERQCAPRLHFCLERDGEAGAVWLRATWPEAETPFALADWGFGVQLG